MCTSCQYQSIHTTAFCRLKDLYLAVWAEVAVVRWLVQGGVAVVAVAVAVEMGAVAVISAAQDALAELEQISSVRDELQAATP